MISSTPTSPRPAVTASSAPPAQVHTQARRASLDKAPEGFVEDPVCRALWDELVKRERAVPVPAAARPAKTTAPEAGAPAMCPTEEAVCRQLYVELGRRQAAQAAAPVSD